MTIKVFFYAVCIFLHINVFSSFSLSDTQPYDDLEKLQLNTVNSVCKKYDLIPAGVSSSCFTAIRNLYFSFKSKYPLYEDQAHLLLFEIMSYIHEIVNKDPKIDIIKISETIDPNFLHVSLFFDLTSSRAECCVDIMNGWINHQIYNYYGNGSILKIKRPLKEALSEVSGNYESILLPDYAKFINSQYFTTHLLRGQPYAQKFIDFGKSLSSRIERETSLCSVEMEDRACNAIESSFGKVRKLFFYGEWPIEGVVYPEEIRPIFNKTISIILDGINNDPNIKENLATFPFTIEDVELVIRPKHVFKNGAKHISIVYNIKNNVIYILCEDKSGGGKVSICENYYDYDSI